MLTTSVRLGCAVTVAVSESPTVDLKQLLSAIYLEKVSTYPEE